MVAMQHHLRLSCHVFLAWLCILTTCCGGRSLNKENAHSAILHSTEDTLRSEEVDILSVGQTAPGQAVVEAEIRMAFTLEKVQDEWKVRDVRVGRNTWQNLEAIRAALGQARVEETRGLLERVAEAAAAFVRDRGALPQFEDFVGLTDVLSPNYLNPLVRLDAWRNPLLAFRPVADVLRLLSAGPDGKTGTADDIELTRSFPR